MNYYLTILLKCLATQQGTENIFFLRLETATVLKVLFLEIQWNLGL